MTTTIDSETLREIRRIAGKRGVSRFLQAAARERLARIRTLGLLDELDAQYGAPSSELKAEVDAEMRKLFRVKPTRGRR